MIELAAQQPGFLGVDSARSDGVGHHGVVLGDPRQHIREWKEHAEHTIVRDDGPNPLVRRLRAACRSGRAGVRMAAVTVRSAP